MALRLSPRLQVWAVRVTRGCPQPRREAWDHPHSPAQGPGGSPFPRQARLLPPGDGTSPSGKLTARERQRPVLTQQMPADS